MAFTILKRKKNKQGRRTFVVTGFHETDKIDKITNQGEEAEMCGSWVPLDLSN